MNTDKLIQSLEEIQKRKEMSLPSRLRPYFEKMDMKNRAVLVFGSRGVGKTTFLLNRFRAEEYSTSPPTILWSPQLTSGV